MPTWKQKQNVYQRNQELNIEFLGKHYQLGKNEIAWKKYPYVKKKKKKKKKNCQRAEN